MELDADGGITVHTVSKAQGHGHETTFAQIVADALDVPLAAGEDRAVRAGEAADHAGQSHRRLAQHGGRGQRVPSRRAEADRRGQGGRRARAGRRALAGHVREGRVRRRRTSKTLGQAGRPRSRQAVHRHGGRQVRLDLSQRLPHRRGRDRSRDRRDGDRLVLRGRRLRRRDQSHRRRRPGPRRRRAGRRPGVRRAHRLRPRDGAAPDRELHGLLHAARGAAARHQGAGASDAEQGEPARREGRGRIGLHRIDTRGRQRGDGRAATARHRAPRHAADAVAGVACAAVRAKKN